ncbi:arylsulfatase A-like enzyme [Maribacter vaceletii]|uniref:Arylsulfatase A-like enzyme n=1 Tax=Maribacter vaceletii TaxID=1206816 RepID=A0A495E5G0_9FLAO|nr:sulfatase [Maribacter vaceletii]RKR12140.1 arylsulfatase A-like enzyme [Maribacter vaceletii]
MKSKIAVAVFIIIFSFSCKERAKSIEVKKQKPNVVFFLVDDLGYSDLSCYGSDFYQTPNIDKLAASGIKFINGYAACTVCSPTRASIMTGKYPATIKCTDWIEGHKVPNAKLKIPEWTMYMDTTEYTMAESFKDAGYITGHFGKWHLGEKNAYWPENNGFTVNKGGWAKGAPNKNKKMLSNGYFSPYGNPRLKDGIEGEYLTERLTKEACSFIEKNKKTPFFLNFWFYNVHKPIQAKKEKIEKYKVLVDDNKHQKNPVYAAMVEHMDDAVGKVMQQLKENGLLDNTIIIFTSDNGGLVGQGENKITNNYPLKGGKGQIYEGGVRVPNIIISPGVTKANTVNETPIISLDYYPTLLELAEVDVPVKVKKKLEGESLVDLMTTNKELERKAIYWHYPHYHKQGATPYSAIRKGDWKLIHTYENDIFELYNLKKDIGEKNNLVISFLDKKEELQLDLDNWLVKVNAQMPILNPNHQK